MRSENFGSVLVVDSGGNLRGVFTERDILTKITCKLEDLTAENVGEFMTADLVTLHEDDLIAQALNLMSVHGFRHIPILNAGGSPVGLLSFRMVVDYIERYLV